jgi:hypothetical protein
VAPNIINGGNENNVNDNNFADILQYVGQWFVTTGDFITVIGQTIALEKDRLDKIQEQKDKQQQELKQQQTQKQIEQMQQQINLLLINLMI